jgi:hypothetical protein
MRLNSPAHRGCWPFGEFAALSPCVVFREVAKDINRNCIGMVESLFELALAFGLIASDRSVSQTNGLRRDSPSPGLPPSGFH